MKMNDWKLNSENEDRWHGLINFYFIFQAITAA